MTKSLRRLVVAVASILVCSMSFLCVTLAKYSTTVDKNINATAKAWEITVTAAGEVDGAVDLGKIAPGSSGSVVVTIANAGEVDATYSIALDSEIEKPEGLTITIADADKTGEVAVNGSKEVTINYSWAFDGNDTDDTSWAGQDISVGVTVTAEQKA